MKYITKSYLKNYFKDVFLSIITFIYLLLFFLAIFVLSSNSVQEFAQDIQIEKYSDKWGSGFSQSYLNWNISFLKNNNSEDIINTNSSGYKLLNNLKDSKGNNLLNKNWANIVLKQSENDRNDNKGSLLEKFQYYLYKDANYLYLTKPKQVKNNISYNINNFYSSSIKKIFNSNANWKEFNWTLNSAILNNGANININNIGYDNSITIYNNTKNNNSIKNVNIAPLNDFRNNMNQVFLQTNKGHMPNNDNEILINEKYAKDNNLKIGSKIKIFDFNINDLNIRKKISNNKKSNLNKIINQEYTIVGYGMSRNASISRNPFIFMSQNQFNNFEKNIINGLNNKNVNFYSNLEWKINNEENPNLDFNDDNNIKFFINNDDKTNILLNKNENYSNIIDNFLKNNYIKNATEVSEFGIDYNNSNYYKSTTLTKEEIIINIIIAIFTLSLGFVFLNFIIKKDINAMKKQIGVFKSIGYKNKELSWIFSLRILLTFLITSLISFVASIPLQIYINKNSNLNTSILEIHSVNINIYFLLIMFLVIPILFTIMSFFTNLHTIKKPISDLLIGENKVKNIWILKPIKKIFIKFPFFTRIQISFTIQELFKWLLIVFIFTLSLTVLIVEKNSFNSLTDQVRKKVLTNGIYTKNVNSDWINEFYSNTINMENNNYLETLYNSDFLENNIQIENFDDQTIKNEIKNSNEYWNNIANNYDIVDLLSSSISKHPYIYASTLEKISNLCNLFGINLDELQKNINTNFINKNKYGKNTIIALNKFLTGGKNYLNDLYLYLTSSIFEKNLGSSTLKIRGIPENFNGESFNKFFTTNGISQSEINEIYKIPEKNGKPINNEIPIIISYRMQKLSNLHIGSIIDNDKTQKWNSITLNTGTNEGINNIKLKVVGIMKDNTINDNCFTGYGNLAKFFKTNDGKSYVNENAINSKTKKLIISKQPKYYYSLFNEVTSTKNLFPNAKTLTDIWKSNGWNIPFITIYNSSSNDLNKNYNIMNMLLKDSWNFDGIFTSRSDSFIPQKAGTLNSEEKIISGSIQTITTIVLSSMIFILLIICVSTIIDENKKVILTFKILGYGNGKINWLTVGNYFIGIILSLFFSYFLSGIVLHLISNYLFNSKKIILNFKNNIYSTISIIIPALLIIFISWILCLKRIKKIKLKELN